MPIEETPVQIADIDDVRSILGACLIYVYADDLKQAQVELRNHRPSPLASEIERIKEKFDSYLGDYLLRRHEEGDVEEDDSQVGETSEGAEDGSESVSEASEEPLSSAPLGDFKPPRQKGRKLTTDEV